MAKLTEEEKSRRALARRRKAALAAEERAIREEKKRREWDVEGVRLTRGEYEAGVACRGCGLSMSDGLGSWPALLKMDEKQRSEHDAADVEFRKVHVECHSHRWSVEGSRTDHCGFCCPPPPLSKAQIEKLGRIFAGVKRSGPSELDVWKLTLTCDHVVEKTQHRSHDSWTGSVAHCIDCGQTRGIVSTERVPPDDAECADEQRKLTAEIDKARFEYEQLKNRADAAQRRMDRLRSKVVSGDGTR